MVVVNVRAARSGRRQAFSGKVLSVMFSHMKQPQNLPSGVKKNVGLRICVRHSHVVFGDSRNAKK